MKRTIQLFLILFFVAVVNAQQITVSPAVFQVNESITITASFVSPTCNEMGTNPAKVYMHSGIGSEANPWATAKGNWGADDGVGLMTKNPNGTWSISITPSVYFGLTSLQQSEAAKMGIVFRNAAGSQTLKLAPSCSDFFLNVGVFQASLASPVENSNTIIASGGSLNISATNTNGLASYNLKSNGVVINSNASTSSYVFNHVNIIGNQSYELSITQSGTTIVKKFTAIVNPGAVSAAMPAGLVDGINYNATDVTKATLVLDAPLKDFVYVAGSFNNWTPTSSYAMKKDPTSGKFWLEITGLVSGENNTYQYWVVANSPIANSPSLVKTADPYSTLVLSPFDDPGIPSTTYPNMPVYPVGQEREVTVLKTGQVSYPWKVANFVKPEKEKLVVYEVLVRDFDAARNYQSLIDKIDYFKNLKVNAIELMPVMEFEGNESWGYNTSFHMALDKFYGTSDKLKEFIDLCHQNGIAVILDVALNHVFGRNPMVRMWMNDPDKDGWGSPSADNPYFNTVAKHSYSVGEDFNHQKALTQNYVKRVIKHWIEEYKIDGFRWDLTKGFTQNCTAGDEACTNRLQQDRVDVLKLYADYSWGFDPTHYTIFEHLGSDAEEKEWANYRITDPISKGVMMWGKMMQAYNQLSMGYDSDSNISRMTSSSRGFTANRLMGYAESHDEERLMYKNIQYGNSNNVNHNVKNLNVALSRMSAIGAVSLLIPGPKMIWHFGDLGWDASIFACKNGVVNDESGTISGDCKLDTKQQPQWTGDWLRNSGRSKIYNDWAKMITMKTTEPVFSGTATVSNINSLSPNIKITNSTLPATELRDVLILANFDVTDKAVATGFPYAGVWYNLMDNTSINITNVVATIIIPAGEFRIYGNKRALLAIEDFEKPNGITLYPNPVTDYFTLNALVSKVAIYSLSGQLVKSFTGNGNLSSEYSVSELNSGLYFVKATDENNNTEVLKFLKK
ncbi:alpha-amylase family glycosyl hydrolase [Flavobacterium sp. 140616W15]|uniref:alpha-amylase family glycosyl hydrolase n=1 Tax=Flavobacterium sp. 140616W15 TaxID=2478552 RepID=UPI000F0D084E|nr:alpha-amylase family glycosyl hydrolase [Flavobacterium sp. 140616W15]AYN05435.1 T9SS C-terminal target domain-containing protein [Flavobacterium sp. 140616W15]